MAILALAFSALLAASCLAGLALGTLSAGCYSAAMNDQTKSSFIKEDPWRVFRIMAEFVDSFETLSRVSPAVTIFGSARISADSPKSPGFAVGRPAELIYSGHVPSVPTAIPDPNT